MLEFIPEIDVGVTICPACREQIKRDRLVCEYCHRVVVHRRWLFRLRDYVFGMLAVLVFLFSIGIQEPAAARLADVCESQGMYQTALLFARYAAWYESDDPYYEHGCFVPPVKRPLPNHERVIRIERKIDQMQ